MTSGQKFNILVIDSDEEMVTMTTAMLEQLGYSAQGETATLPGLQTFSQDPDKFDLAIIEPAMSGQTGLGLAARGSMRRGFPVTPELTGLELAVRFRRIKQGFPILLYAGYLEPSLAENIKVAGLAEAIPKPLELRELEEAVREGLRSYPSGMH